MDGSERSVDLHLASALSLQCLQATDCSRPRSHPGASQRRSGKPKMIEMRQYAQDCVKNRPQWPAHVNIDHHARSCGYFHRCWQ
ncbi:hypothetical protein FHT82_001186 [Rhizobium sp. BK275]|uniref:hypothetical protein n=1 Tax=unclassified Rhizobium TaxID=2613769 RepID=UPI001614BE99|nr:MULTISPECIES: hypothetical protein [unclassified Rhizobium]MBB3388466.1 hypothetical protein [Rhizobium sp. BK275]